MENQSKYWAMLPRDQIGPELVARVTEFYAFCESTGRMTLWNNLHKAYYAGSYSNGNIKKGGEEDEFKIVEINHFHANLTRLGSITEAQRMSVNVKAANTDESSLEKASLVNDIREFYQRDERLEMKDSTAGKFSRLYSEGWIVVDWNPRAGQEHGPAADDDGFPVLGTNGMPQSTKKGDVDFKVYMPDAIIRDVSLTDLDKRQWIITRDKINKWELATTYSAQADTIIAQEVNSGLDSERTIGYSSDRGRVRSGDQVTVYTFRHDKTEACPEGVKAVFLENGEILEHGSLGARKLYAFVVKPEQEDGTPFGYSLSFDLLVPQRLYNGMMSAAATNTDNGSIPIIWTREPVKPEFFKRVMTLFQSPTKPEAINVNQTPPEVYNFAEILRQQMVSLSGLNAASTGDSDTTKNMPGIVLQMLENMTIRFVNSYQASMALFREQYWTALIELLQDNAAVERLIVVAGKENRSRAIKFKKEDLEGITGVFVDMGNPLNDTATGRMNRAMELLKAGLIKSINEFVLVCDTGSVDQFYDINLAEALLVRQENELLAKGNNPAISATDDHAYHLKHNSLPAKMPDARNNPAIDGAVAAHCLVHVQFLKDMKFADMLAIMGQKPLSQMDPGAPPPSGGPEGIGPIGPGASMLPPGNEISSSADMTAEQ